MANYILELGNQGFTTTIRYTYHQRRRPACNMDPVPSQIFSDLERAIAYFM